MKKKRGGTDTPFRAMHRILIYTFILWFVNFKKQYVFLLHNGDLYTIYTFINQIEFDLKSVNQEILFLNH